MYFECSLGKGVLKKENLYYSGDTSMLYLDNGYIYKVYTKNEPFKRNVLDILINKNNLRDIGVLPIKKLKTDTGNYGMIMRYVSNSITFRKYLKYRNVEIDTFINIMISLSDNLKRINNEQIHFPDLHHNNILIKNDKPIYIDFDDAVVHDYNSTHISQISYDLHDVKDKSYEYEGKLIQYGNLDQETLYIMLFDYLLDTYIERWDIAKFNKFADILLEYFPNQFVDTISKLKTLGEVIEPYQYYVGDFIKNKEIQVNCRKLRRDFHEYNYI